MHNGGTAYSFAIPGGTFGDNEATGFTYAVAVTPAGLTLTETTGTLAGSPANDSATEGTYTVTVTATDNVASVTVDDVYSLYINYVPTIV